MRAARAYLLLGLLVVTVAGSGRAQTLTDALYDSHHPRLLFTPAEISAIADKLSDGGLDDATYVSVRQIVQDVYPTMSYTDILGPWYGDQAIPCIGLVGHLEDDEDALALGKALTLHIANAYNVDNDEGHSGMRLRALVLGYDLCFKHATETERAIVRDEIVLYVQRMIWNTAYEVFEVQPYLGNHSAMFGAPLGMAAIALQGETEEYLLTDAMAMADRIVDNLLRYQFDPAGAYNEGAFYAAWTLKQLVYYFDARRRFDGRAYTDNPQLGLIEEWFAYELLPEGSGRYHNLNDTLLLSAPLAQHPTFFNWAMGTLDSGLSSWLWRHTAGDLGANLGAETDRAGTILWHKSVPPVDPGTVLPPGRVWAQRGLYCYRSGWQTAAGSNDLFFSFYSGKFQGGHAQEDQNQFALTAYGTAFALDHGPGSIAKESESHNLVFIDGQGQHNAGSSIGTDGAITGYLLGDFADIVTGDATAAYGTHSEFNAPNVPVDGADWSWGYSGANPVRFAHRRVLLVHGESALPYAVVMDDIDKDGATHDYAWRLHTAATNTVTIDANPIVIAGTGATMNLHLVNPSWSNVSVATSAYNAANTDPASTLIQVTRTTVSPRFTFLMIPRAAQATAPLVSHQSYSWGCGATIDWGNGLVDILVRNDSEVSRSYAGIRTDAKAAMVRKTGSGVESYVMMEGRALLVSGVSHVSIADTPASCEFAGTTAWLDRYDADFRIRDTGVTRVLCRNQELGFVVDNGYLVPDGVTGAGPAPAAATLSVRAHPNPFNPTTMIHIEGLRNEPTSVTVYDVAGRRVRELWSGMGGAGRALAWDGRNDGGLSVASGTYFIRVATPSRTRTLKLTLVK